MLAQRRARPNPLRRWGRPKGVQLYPLRQVVHIYHVLFRRGHVTTQTYPRSFIGRTIWATMISMSESSLLSCRNPSSGTQWNSRHWQWNTIHWQELSTIPRRIRHETTRHICRTPPNEKEGWNGEQSYLARSKTKIRRREKEMGRGDT
jgi:hypothetical protein